MAPPSGTRKSRQTANSKQSGRAVVPAIPLPHVRRQAAAADAKSPITSSLTAKTDQAAEANQPKAESPRSSVSGSAHQVSDSAKPKSAGSDVVSDNSSLAEKSVSKGAENLHDTTNAESSLPLHTNMQADVSQKAGVDVHVNGVGQNQQMYADEDKPNSGFTMPRPLPPVSPARYQQPPGSQAKHRHPARTTNGAAQGRLSQEHINIAQVHLANGSAHLGSFGGSTSSSPAPHFGGIAPPPGMHPPNGIQPFVSPDRANFPLGFAPGRSPLPLAGFNNHGRPNIAFSPLDPNQNYHPPTAQAYQDSHSSMTQEDGISYQQAPPNGVSTLVDGIHPIDAQGRAFGDHAGLLPHYMPPPSMISHADEAGGLIMLAQQHFGSPEFADCLLEVRHLNGIPMPRGIPAHRLVLSRSPILKDLIHGQNLRPGPTDQTWFQPLVLETDNRWIRADSFHIAVQNIYGYPLFQAPRPNPNRGMDSEDTTVAGSLAERFRFALSYAAAGHILGWGPVVQRGCEIAAQLLDATTVEKALEFALEGYCDKGAYEEFKYGNGSRALLHATVIFIVNNLHPLFNLDNLVTIDPGTYARLPFDSTSAPKAVESPVDSPVIARGSSVAHLAKGVHPRSHRSIQFGDFDVPGGQSPDTQRSNDGHRQASDALLSRLLLNLPFGFLKMLIEGGPETGRGWTNPGTWYRLVQEIIGEREARRLRALEAVISGNVPDSTLIQESLRSPEPRIPKWSALGWHEEITTRGNTDGLFLSRQWTPLKSAPSGNGAEFP
ncbi:unnamed protein product [Clonostachys rosea f. rosea IK726]|uniref:BTB domain-containing protein n=4 Tax=Bionectria ochroleuca TaxID=29856 RepID=A0A0B7JSS0_BIOOC|nr:unnamed protein product [Clonostachys rosea f. rosea IK726]